MDFLLKKRLMDYPLRNEWKRLLSLQVENRMYFRQKLLFFWDKMILFVYRIHMIFMYFWSLHLVYFPPLQKKDSVWKYIIFTKKMSFRVVHPIVNRFLSLKSLKKVLWTSKHHFWEVIFWWRKLYFMYENQQKHSTSKKSFFST